MSVFRKLAVQAGVAVVRESTGKVLDATPIQSHEDLARRRHGKPKDVKRETWRGVMRRLTNDGKDVMEVLYNLAMGNVLVAQLPDGRVSEPMVPSPEVRRAAAVDLLHMLHGKPVAQTEVVKAEQEAEDVAQYAALSDEQLEELLAEAGWKKAEQKRLAASGVLDDDE
jgi:hypothetical protein